MTTAATALHYGLVSFDLDGTLVETAGEIAEAANRALASNGMPRRPVARDHALIGAGTRDLMLRLLAAACWSDPALAARVRRDDVLASMDEHYARTAGTSRVRTPAAPRRCTRCGAAGVELACVTNKELRHARRVLEVDASWRAISSCVIGGDSLPQKKPHATVAALRRATRSGVPAGRVAHVGDSSIDVAAARNAGVAAWAVPYGYNGGEPIADAEPDRIFQSLGEISAYVLAANACAAVLTPDIAHLPALRPPDGAVASRRWPPRSASTTCAATPSRAACSSRRRCRRRSSAWASCRPTRSARRRGRRT